MDIKRYSHQPGGLSATGGYAQIRTCSSCFGYFSATFPHCIAIPKPLLRPFDNTLLSLLP